MDMRQNIKGSLGVIFANRNIFNNALVAEAKDACIALGRQFHVPLVFPLETGTAHGAIETLQDARICAKVLSEHREELIGLIVILANFGNEIGVAESIRMSDLHLPILIQASTDVVDKVDVHSRRDAFCGKISVCNNLHQYGIPFSLTSRHTEDITSDLFAQDLADFIAVCRTVDGIKHARIAQFGVRPADFQTVRYSEKLLQASGVTVVPVDLATVLGRAEKELTSSTLIEEKISSLRAYGTIPDRIHKEQLRKVAALSLAIERYMEELDCQAAALLCWDTLQYSYGCASCVSMSMLSESLLPLACESDVLGALSMYALTLASCQSSALLDWNNNYGEQEDICVCTHCSSFPKSFMKNPIEISELDILGNTIGKEYCFGAVKGKVAPGPFTFARFSTDDRNGRIIGYFGEGEFLDRPFPMDGGIAVTKVANLQYLLKAICMNGFEHHVAMTRGQWAHILSEASRYLEWETYWHEGRMQPITL